MVDERISVDKEMGNIKNCRIADCLNIFSTDVVLYTFRQFITLFRKGPAQAFIAPLWTTMFFPHHVDA